MVDPKMLIDLALPELKEQIKRLLAEAASHRNEQKRCCVAYLRAAQKAGEALHKEFEAIIEEAQFCTVEKEDDVIALKRRVFRYLNSNDIRPDLWTAVVGLKASRDSLQERVDSILDAPWKKEKRQVAVAMLGQTIQELDAFLRGLGEQRSGVGLDVLLELQSCLERQGLKGSDISKVLATPRAAEDLRQRKWLAEQTEGTIAKISDSF
jgi:hypothetical protein